MEAMLMSGLSGGLWGLGYGLMAWANKRTENKAAFDLKPFLQTTLVSAAVGAGAGYLGQDFNAALNGGLGLGVSRVITKLLKILI